MSWDPQIWLDPYECMCSTFLKTCPVEFQRLKYLALMLWNLFGCNTFGTNFPQIYVSHEVDLTMHGITLANLRASRRVAVQ